jgi:Glyoxalase-like domain
LNGITYMQVSDNPVMTTLSSQTSPPNCATLDHLVIGCRDLALGAQWLERFLGVTLSDIGVHTAMGTHNRLVNLGGERYLELIAINPAAAQPAIPRWFGLDTPDVQARIALRPRLIGWVARTDNIEAVSEHTGGILGSVHAMMRGEARWKITNPDDGFPIEGGLIPHLIEWQSAHPTTRLPDQALRFTWMEAAHPNPAKVEYLLTEMGLTKSLVLTASPPYSGMTMCAYIETPLGTRTLMS